MSGETTSDPQLLLLHQQAAFMEASIDGTAILDEHGRYLFLNERHALLYGYRSASDLIGQSWEILYDKEERERIRTVAMPSVFSDGSWRGEAVGRRSDGSYFDQEISLCRVKGQGLVCVVRDITAGKSLERERERLLKDALERADNDALTGLLNHRAFHRRLEDEANRALRDGGTFVVAVMDLDNFKFFNDAYGHTSGDEVLRRVAGALKKICRTYDVLARFGGDEFALLSPGLTSREVDSLVMRLRRCTADIGFQPPGYNTIIPLELTIGTAVFPADGMDRHDALEVADTRLRRAKTGGTEDEAGALRDDLTRSLEGFSVLDALVTAVDNKDRYTRRHSEDVMNYSAAIAKHIGMDGRSIRTVEIAALLHDVGKIGVPDRVLRKPGQLTDIEFAAVKHHPLMGAIIVGAVDGFEETLDAVRHHHERWDGGGYPFGLVREETPLMARLMAVADAFSAMTTDRPYRKGMSHERALSILEEGAGIQWDPKCVAAFLSTRGCILHRPDFEVK